MYTFERNQPALPIPPTPPRIRYPFDQMKAGDCIHFDDFRRAESARVAAIQFVRRRGLDWRFSMRKSCDGWRIIRIY
jgi:hypothetical protein